MTNFNFPKYNKIVGWCAFTIALITYSLTVEPTASFWDAGEYISTSSKLEIGHPPGAPLYQMLGAFFSIFAPDATYVALCVNFMSCLASAFTILFMCWSISLLLRKLLKRNKEVLSSTDQIAVLAASFIGSTAFAFTDSFWFNAVEAEVYAMAMFMLSALFYVALLWERDMFKPRGNRWLMLICFIVGLSFGVHFMALLTIPAIGFLYFFKNYKTITIKNFIVANVIVVAVLMFIFKFLLPYTLSFFGYAEVFFVNSFGLPFNSGTIIAGIVFIGIFYFLLKFTRKKSYYQLNTLILSILFIFIGFSSWLMLPIRANAGTTINENNPNNARELLAYYNREQYPETHLFYGPQFTEIYGGLDAQNPYIDGKPNYEKDEKSGKYIIINEWENAVQNSEDRHKVFLPRMWSTDHIANYMQFTGPLQFQVKPEYADNQELQQAVAKFKSDYAQGRIDNEGFQSFLMRIRQYIDVDPPSFSDNLAYLFDFQFGYMYWRYFMWNFTGRQDDIQGNYDDIHGNWLSGISFIDEARLGPQDNLPSDVLNNKGRNMYFFLPLILGLLGLVFQASKDKKSFWVLLVLFLFTGIALKIYLNERAFEPRERDYALVGSFYVFAMWIGFGVYALYDMLKDKVSSKIVLPAITVVCLLAAPVILASQNWDDHDRSNRKTALAMAKMYLDSCDENAILFTIGDNDTFALWYAQEIEGYRRDVRIVNTSLFQTSWYIDDMKRKAYESDPIPSQLTHDKYVAGNRDAIWYNDLKPNDTLDIKTWMNWIASDDIRTMEELQSGTMVHTYPTKLIRIPVDKNTVLSKGIVPQKDSDLIVPSIVVNIKEDVLYKNRLLMLDVIANNNWERPIYFTGGSFGDDDYLWMKDYLQLDGVCYKLVPIRTPIDPQSPYDMGRIDSEKFYNIAMNWYWGNSGDPDVYHDTETRRNGITYRGNLARLTETLINEKQFGEAKDVLDLAMEKMPVDTFEYYTLLEPYISGYYQVGEQAKARKLWGEVAKKYQEKLNYWSTVDLNRQYKYAQDIITDIERYRSLVDLLIRNQDQEILPEKAKEFNSYLRKFSQFYGENETAPETSQPTEQIRDSSIAIPRDTTR
ncbi:glycosyltransferase family 117 protein [Leeuwenhoekiella aequorea]|uniref:Uncharacterized protein n=1 Tax=Leeuwenhoekiella aequorea TaxID=283736 RepID=A0A4Q0PDX3_9FLAO|nr:DUF2723 domain-containing protein [Leeuwenhoekiella aequorea]RXG24646.1 putative protein DUF2723 [Leeuwenhoekiella aequorea]